MYFPRQKQTGNKTFNFFFKVVCIAYNILILRSFSFTETPIWYDVKLHCYISFDILHNPKFYPWDNFSRKSPMELDLVNIEYYTHTILCFTDNYWSKCIKTSFLIHFQIGTDSFRWSGDVYTSFYYLNCSAVCTSSFKGGMLNVTVIIRK